MGAFGGHVFPVRVYVRVACSSSEFPANAVSPVSPIWILDSGRMHTSCDALQPSYMRYTYGMRSNVVWDADSGL